MARHMHHHSGHDAALFVAALGLGAIVMYLCDPQSGRRRRARIHDQYTHVTRKLHAGADKALRDAGNRAQGLVAEARRVLVEHRPKARRPGARLELMQENWSPAWRSVTGALGASLTAAGWIRGGLRGLVLGAAGAVLTARAAANRPVAALVGLAGASRGIIVRKTLHIDAPVAEVYHHWSVENFPQWMSHVKDVRALGEGRYHWVVEGPAGVPVEWVSEITAAVENRELAWRSVEGSSVDNAGRVDFAEDNGGTSVQVSLCYMPPAGHVGHFVAKALGADAGSRMDDDLRRFKALIETGRPARDGAGQPGTPPWPSSDARH